MSLEYASEIFKKLKPKCVVLAQLTLSEESTKSGSLQLLNAIKDLDESLKDVLRIDMDSLDDETRVIPVNLADYIMVPITKLFKNDTITDSELEHSLSIINTLLIHSWCQPGHLSNELFIQYTTLISFLIGGKPGQFSISAHSDETFLNGVKCLQSLLRGCLNQNTSFIENVLKNNKFIPTLGFLVSILLNIAVESHNSVIKVRSLETLNVLFHLLNDGEILSLFFPGSVSSIAKIIKSKPHSDVISNSFIALSTLVNSIFSDFELGTELTQKINSLDSLEKNISNDNGEEDFFTNLSNAKAVSINIPEESDVKRVHRTSSWLATTIIQFKKALQIILKIDINKYDKHSVRDSVFQFNIKIIRNCFLSCGSLVPMLLKSLSTICSIDPSFTSLTVDSLIYISEISSLKLVINNLIDDELRIMHYNLTSPDPTKAEEMLQFINLLLEILDGIGDIDESIFEGVLAKLAETLTIIIELKSSSDNKKKISNFNSTTVNGQSGSVESQIMLISSNYLEGSFDEIRNVDLFNGVFTKETENLISFLLKVISKNINSLTNIKAYLVPDNYLNSSDINYQVALSVSSWILSSILEYAEFNMDSTINSIDNFLQFDDEDDDDYVDINGTSSDKNAQTRLLIKNLSYPALEASVNVLKQYSNMTDDSYSIIASTIMSLRIIDNSIEIQKDEFADELIDVLYPVVECLASSNESIRIEAQCVVLKIADLLYDGSIPSMLSENSDYLVDSLSSKLVGESLTPKIPIILSVLVKIGSMDIVAELDDIIRTIFTLLDMYYGYDSLVEGFFLVFNEVILKVYANLKDFDFEKLAIDMEEENVLQFGMWGLNSMQEVEDFINKKAVGFEDLINDSDDDDNDNGIMDSFNTPEEALRKDKILEIDSDDSDEENDTKSIPSVFDDKTTYNDDDDSDNKWTSPVDIKLYNTIANILAYTERLVQSNSISLRITLLKIVLKLIPLLATQKSRFLPLAVDIWEVTSHMINENTDLRIIGLCISILQDLIKYGQTFFTTRFISIFTVTKENGLIQSLISKQVEILVKSRVNNFPSNMVLNKTSMSVNWDTQTFNKICEFFIFSLFKLGRFIPNDIAMSIVDFTIYFDDNAVHYGYFDDLVLFLQRYKQISKV